jgi:hypothetical protein
MQIYVDNEVTELRQRIAERDNEVTELRRRIAELELENADLRAQTASVKASSWVGVGNRGEEYVAKLIGGKMTRVSEHYDVLTKNGIRMEVKTSTLNLAVESSTTRRWTWTLSPGFATCKHFDCLILVGDVDPRFRDFYRERRASYILFDVPYEALLAVVRHTSSMVQLSTNPKTARTAVAKALYKNYQVTHDEFISKYG